MATAKSKLEKTLTICTPLVGELPQSIIRAKDYLLVPIVPRVGGTLVCCQLVILFGYLLCVKQ